MEFDKSQLYSYSSDQLTKYTKKITINQLSQELQKQAEVSWFNMHRIPSESELKSISDVIKLHRTTREDILDLSQRPKVEEFENYLFFSLSTYIPKASNEKKTEQISFILGDNVLISIQERKSDHFQEIRQRLETNLGIIRNKKADYLLYKLLDAIIDNYFSLLDQLSAEIEEMDFQTVKSPTPETLNKIEQHKRTLIYLRKLVFPLKETVARLDIGFPKFIEPENEPYFRDLRDNTQSILDEIDTHKQILDSLAQLYYANLSHRMNEIMKFLTMVGTIFIPLTFIAGIYGMNFAVMPELEWKYGYASVWIVMIVLTIILLLYFKRKKWL